MSYTSVFSSSKSLFLIILLVCISIGFAADELIPQQVLDWQTAAAELEKSKDYAGARAEYEKIIQGYPNTSYGLKACAKNASLYIKQKQFDSLDPVVEQICTNFTNQPLLFAVCSDLIEDCMYAKNYSAAESICTQVESRLSSNPRITQTVGWRGMLYAAQGNLEGAKQERQTLLQKKDCIASDFLGGMCNIGLGYYNTGELDESLETYRLGLERDPNHPQAVYLQYQIAKTMLAKDDVAGADKEMQILLTKYGHRANTPGLAFRLGNEYYKKWKFQGAINVYEKLLAQFGDHELVPSIRDAIVETYAEAGDLTKAQQALQTDIEQCPHRRELLRVITRVAVDTARAGDLNTVCAGDPNIPNTTASLDTPTKLVDAIFAQNPEGADQQLFGYTTRARVYVHQGKDAEAAATVDEALELFKDHPDSLAYHLFGVGEEYYLMGEKALQNDDKATAEANYLKAIAMWDKMINQIQSPRLCPVYYYAAACCQNIGQTDKAMEYFGHVVTKWPDYKKAWYAQYQIARIYEIYMMQGKASTAEVKQAYQVLLEKYPTCSVVKIAIKKLNTL